MSSREIIEYYSQSRADYRRFWGTESNLSIHYGFHDDSHRRHGDALANMNRVLAETAGIVRGEQVLDAGCGVGGSSIWLARNVGAKVVGININRMQVEMARAKAAQGGVESLVRFITGDFANTPFPDGYFDVVWGLESICYAEDKKQFLREARRLLKKGGRVVIADGFLAREDLNRRERRDMRRWLDGWAVRELSSIAQFKLYLDELGFDGIRFRNVTANVMPSSKRMFATGVLLFPLAKYLEWIRARSSIQAGHLVSTLYQHLTLRRGLWEYGIFCGRR